MVINLKARKTSITLDQKEFLGVVNRAKFRLGLTDKQIPYKMEIRRQNNYTIASFNVFIDGKSEQFIGVSKRNMVDNDNPIHGARIAMNRALEEYAIAIEKKVNNVEQPLAPWSMN